MSTPKHGHPPIKMQRRDKFTLLNEAGCFWWRFMDGKRSLIVALPNQRWERGYFPSAWPVDQPNSTGDQWSWDGNEDEPTLSPSLHAVGEWHGWVQNGMLVEA